MAKRHRVRGYPTFVLVDAGGEEIDRLVGYGGAPQFATDLGAALADPSTVAQKEARFRAGPNAADAARLGRVAAGRNDPAAALGWYRQAQRLDPAGNYAFPIFEAVDAGFGSELMTASALRAAADAVFAAPDAKPDELLSVGYQMSLHAKRGQGRALRQPYLAQALARTEGVADPDLRPFRRALEIEHALYNARDPQRAVALKRETLAAGWQDDATLLRRFAWWCCQNRVNLEEAEALALRAAGIAADGPARATALHVAAEIHVARGDPRGALTLARQAAAADPSDTDQAQYLQRLRDLARRADPSR